MVLLVTMLVTTITILYDLTYYMVISFYYVRIVIEFNWHSFHDLLVLDKKIGMFQCKF